MGKKRRPSHNYSNDMKKLCLSRVGVGPERKASGKMSPYAFATDENTPSPATLYRWKKQQQQPQPSTPPLAQRGRPPRLSEVELKVIGGWVLHRDQQHKQTSSKLIRQFIAKHFHTTMSDAWVSKTMRRLHLTSHRAATKDRKYRKHQISNALVMNGEVLPPVIFTNCPTVPQGVEADQNAKVIYVPQLDQPTGELTLRWLAGLEEYLNDQPLLVHDKGSEFEANVVKEYCDLHRIQMVEIPSAGGAFVNPCNNPFNSHLKHNYFTQEQKSYPGKLKAIIQAYYAPSTEALVNYFKHVLWTGPKAYQS